MGRGACGERELNAKIATINFHDHISCTPAREVLAETISHLLMQSTDPVGSCKQLLRWTIPALVCPAKFNRCSHTSDMMSLIGSNGSIKGLFLPYEARKSLKIGSLNGKRMPRHMDDSCASSKHERSNPVHLGRSPAIISRSAQKRKDIIKILLNKRECDCVLIFPTRYADCFWCIMSHDIPPNGLGKLPPLRCRQPLIIRELERPVV